MPHHQVHGTKTVIIDDDFLSKNPLEQVLALDGVDALSTQLSDVFVCVKTADCIPVLLWDDATHVVSAVHAGWKGTQKRIVEANIDVLQTTYGTQPSNLHAIIGPGIGPESFEVGDEVYDLFAQAGFPMERLAKKYPIMHPNNPHGSLPLGGGGEGFRWHIDLWECNRHQLIECGIPDKHIRLSGICTYQQCEDFFSARRLGIHSGRIFTGVMLLPNK